LRSILNYIIKQIYQDICYLRNKTTYKRSEEAFIKQYKPLPSNSNIMCSVIKTSVIKEFFQIEMLDK